MDKMTIEDAQAIIGQYKRQNKQLWDALCVLFKYVDATDTQLEEEKISRSDVLKKARDMKQEYQAHFYEGMVIQNIAKSNN